MEVRLGRYAIVYTLLIIGLAALDIALEELTGKTGANWAAIAVPPMIAAMIEGQRVARATGQLMDKGTAWRWAFKMTGVVILVNIPLGIIVFTVGGVPLEILQGPIMVLFSGILILILVLSLLLNRFALRMGMKSELKRLAKQGLT